MDEMGYMDRMDEMDELNYVDGVDLVDYVELPRNCGHGFGLVLVFKFCF